VSLKIPAPSVRKFSDIAASFQLADDTHLHVIDQQRQPRWIANIFQRLLNA
jgi:hypothetical protein